jgi:DNA-binding SARP family transcriptional activator
LHRGDDLAAVEIYSGPVLPEDGYEDWAIAARERVALAIIDARRRLAARAAAAGAVEDVISHTSGILELDPYDERAHEMLVRILAAADRRGDAVRAELRYRQRMEELGVQPQDLLTWQTAVER